MMPTAFEAQSIHRSTSGEVSLLRNETSNVLCACCLTVSIALALIMNLTYVKLLFNIKLFTVSTKQLDTRFLLVVALFVVASVQ